MKSNNDLVWNLDDFRERKHAANFVKGFEKSFCVFSSSVNQLYSSYSIEFTELNPKNILIIPNPYKYHDTFNAIPEHAVMKTNVQVVRSKGTQEVFIRIPFKAGRKTHHVLPFQKGMELIHKQSHASNPFLPVLIKGDLRALDVSTPYLHLHRISLPALKSLSKFEYGVIKDTILTKLCTIR